jgi:LysM repeat protein
MIYSKLLPIKTYKIDFDEIIKIHSFFVSSYFLSTLYAPAKGQDKPYYIVQEGDSLWQIAARFGVAIEDLQEANGLSDARQVVIGAQLVIPEVSGVNGRLDTVTVSYGETLRSLSRQYGLSQVNPVEWLVRAFP